jgi:hypothetical protein
MIERDGQDDQTTAALLAPKINQALLTVVRFLVDYHPAWVRKPDMRVGYNSARHVVMHLSCQMRQNADKMRVRLTTSDGSTRACPPASTARRYACSTPAESI